MLLRTQRKGKKVFINENELQEYMSEKLNELTSLGSNMVTALIMISMIVVLTYFKAGDVFYYALILLPLLARWFIGNMVNKWLRNKFKELLII